MLDALGAGWRPRALETSVVRRAPVLVHVYKTHTSLWASFPNQPAVSPSLVYVVVLPDINLIVNKATEISFLALIPQLE